MLIILFGVMFVDNVLYFSVMLFFYVLLYFVVRGDIYYYVEWVLFEIYFIFL